MRVLLVAVIAITGCYRPTNPDSCTISCVASTECPDDFGCGQSGLCSSDNQCAGDVAIDGGPDVPAGLCFGTFWQPCVELTAPTLPLIASDFDSDHDSNCIVKTQPGALVESCVLAAQTITASVNFRAHGSRPLVLVADTINVDGLDVSSNVAQNGAGACVDLANVTMNGGTAVGAPTGSCGGGGAGGSNSETGGAGGNVSINGDTGSAGGTPAQTRSIPTFGIGGCPGGDGGDSDVSNAGGPPGRGGGAVVLIARTSIQISGFIDASGSGGRGARHQRGGGGGGGAGGLIVLDAPTVVVGIGARLLASGGGGGGGGGDNDEVQGAGNSPNHDATTGGMTTGNGGSSTTTGGDGGDGSTDGISNGTAGDQGSNAGAGGGGGSAGFILMFTLNRQDSALFEIPTPIVPN